MTGDQLVLPQQLQLNYSTYFSPGRKNRFLASTQSPGRSRHAVLIIFSSIPVFFSQTAPHVNNNTQFSYIWTSLLVNKNQACILVLVFTLYHLTYFNLVMEMSPGLREAWKDANSYKCCLLIRKLYPRQKKFQRLQAAQYSIRTDIKFVYGFTLSRLRKFPCSFTLSQINRTVHEKHFGILIASTKLV